MLSQLGYFLIQVSKELSTRYLYEIADTVLYSKHKNESRGEVSRHLSVATGFQIPRFLFTVVIEEEELQAEKAK